MIDRIPTGPTRPAGLLCLIVLAVAACDSPPASAAAHRAALAGPDGPAASRAPVALGQVPNLGAQIAALRDATAEYHRIEEALADGYTVLVRHPETGAACLESEDGGMGRHMLNPGLVGDNSVTITEPEVLIYEPTRNGGLRLVGVEYVIPYAFRDVNQDPPVLFGQTFQQNSTFDLWALHVYAWKHNPEGVFAAWNRTISCDFDEG